MPTTTPESSPARDAHYRVMQRACNSLRCALQSALPGRSHARCAPRITPTEKKKKKERNKRQEERKRERKRKKKRERKRERKEKKRAALRCASVRCARAHLLAAVEHGPRAFRARKIAPSFFQMHFLLTSFSISPQSSSMSSRKKRIGKQN